MDFQQNPLLISTSKIPWRYKMTLIVGKNRQNTTLGYGALSLNSVTGSRIVDNIPG
ncbi:hypothetical protein NUACC26_049090 [Scytonema sp. NUACC26]